jgi:hypothetical protein
MSTALPAVEERQIDGNYGEIFHNGHYQGDIRDFSGRIAIERRELPRAGTNGIVYRRGRITRDGALRIGKIDSRWENLFIDYANTSEDEKRRRRGAGIPIVADAQLLIKIDDPESFGAEEVLLYGVKFWEIPIGFTQNDMIERDVPCTWQSEALVKAIARPGNKLQSTVGSTPTGQQTWPAVGRDPDPVI